MHFHRLPPALLLCAVTPVAAAVKLDRPVAQGSRTTYASLLQRVCPDLKVDAEDPTSAAATISIRHLDPGGQPHEFDGEFKVRDARLVNVRIPGTSPLLLMFTAEPAEGDMEPHKELALFQLSPVPRLLDALELPLALDFRWNPRWATCGTIPSA